MSPTKKKRWWFYPVFLCVLCLFLAVASELVVHLFWSPAHPRWPRTRTFDPDVGLIHVPGKYHLPFRRCTHRQDDCHDVTIDFTANRAGFRSTRDFHNPPGRPLIAVIGDSMVEAAQVSDNQTACALIEQQLRSQFPNAEVRNYGMLGAGFVHYYARWQKFIAEARPDIVVIAASAYNDFRNSSTEAEKFPPMRPHYRSGTNGSREVYFQESDQPGSLANYFELIRFWYWWRWITQDHERIEKGGHDLEAYREPPREDYKEALSLGTDYLERLIREAKASGADVIVISIPWWGELIRPEWDKGISRLDQTSAKYVRNRPEELVRKITKRSGARYVSLRAFLQGLPETELYTMWNWGSDVHFSEEGNKKMAECLIDPINELLESRNHP